MGLEEVSTGERRNRTWRILGWTIGGLLALGAALFGTFLFGLWLYHPKLIYKPIPHESKHEPSLLGQVPQYVTPEVLTLTAPDGTALRAYWMRHPSAGKGNAQKKLDTLLFLHGNMGDVHESLHAISGWQRHMPLNAMLISYRGFGYSKGTPSMAGLRMDSQTALDHLMRLPDVDPSRVFLYGHSLGGAVALHLTAANPHSFMAVVIENTFLSIAKMASHAQPKIAWATFMVTETWDNEAQIRKLKEAVQDKTKRAAHVLFITGEHDHVVPPAQMTELWRQVQELGHVRPEIKVSRMHMDLCKHTCFGVAGYHDHLSRFYYSISGERTMQTLALPKNAPSGSS